MKEATIVLALSLGGCAGMLPPATIDTGAAELKNAAGQAVGTASFTEVSGGVRLVVELRGLPPGAKAVQSARRPQSPGLARG